jgi:molybdenum cofactor cytidylyltransferase
MNGSFTLNKNPDETEDAEEHLRMDSGGYHGHDVAAIVLAAGLSRRMGRPKMFLPWGKTTVIQQVLNVLESVGLRRILVISGGHHSEMALMLKDTRAEVIFNAEYAISEMLVSFQIGLNHLMIDNPCDNCGRVLPREIGAALTVLGDQPQIETQVVQSILDVYKRTKEEIIVPSFQNRRGHPWLVSRTLWPELLNIPADQSLRSFLNRHNEAIHYLECNRPSILKDLDTPQDWENERPG